MTDPVTPPELWLVRHGPTAWSDSGRHTGLTDIALTNDGERDARALAPALTGRAFGAVWTSPLARARNTARLAGFPDARVDADLHEWDYGELEGITTPDVRARGGEFAAWTIWRGPVPSGETLASVAARATRVLERVRGVDGDVLVFAHGHFLRVLAAVALGFAPAAGAHFALDPATINVVGSEHGVPALRRWNAPPVRL